MEFSFLTAAFSRAAGGMALSLFLLGSSDAAPTCGKAGAPCSGTSTPASQPANGAVNLGAGNPINVITGNKYQEEVDMAALPGVLGLEIVRHYNSALSHASMVPGAIGRGWRLSYETSLRATKRAIEIHQADGSIIMFGRELGKANNAASRDPAQGKIDVLPTSRGDEYLWTWSDGHKLRFDHSGKLDQIQAPTGEILSLQYDRRGLLVKVTDPQGRTLRLAWLDGATERKADRFRGVQNIDSPIGRFAFGYGSTKPAGSPVEPIRLLANLVKVSYPDAVVARRYHYEDPAYPTLLTGISVEDKDEKGKPTTSRYATFGYQADGRAVLSTRAGNADKVTLDFSQPDVTTVTNSLGQKTVYRYAVIANENRLLEVRGAGCALCGEPNMRYTYDKLARLIASNKLDEKGNPLQTTKTELDYYGRPLRVGVIGYINGKALPEVLQTRYEYGSASAEPTLVARPSVIPGKEYRIVSAYNDKGQPIRISESGWEPSLVSGNRPGSQTVLAFAGEAKPISRTTRYRYASINGNSVLIETDGPLPNGPRNSPIDSDITQLGWDSKGTAITRLTAPGNFISTMTNDEIGRVMEVVDDEGKSTKLSYDGRNNQSGVTRNGVTATAVYDAMNNLVEFGYGKGKDYRPVERHGFDDADRKTWSANLRGFIQTQRFDTEGHLLQSQRQNNRMFQIQQYSYDNDGRLTSIRDNTDKHLRLSYDSRGMPQVLDDSESSTFPGRAPVHADKNSAIAPVPSVRKLVDDFGRIVATISPNAGVNTYQFDAVDHLIASTDANGNSASYEHEVAGRIARQVIRPVKPQAAGQADIVTRWVYQGRRLVALHHPTQSETYQYDKRGMIINKTVSIKKNDGSILTAVTRHRYDATGQLTGVSLPDGSEIDYQRDWQGQIVAVARRHIQTPWLRWLAPASTLAKDIVSDMVGLQGYTTGNGIVARYQRSSEGILARVVYTNTNGKSTQLALAQTATDTLAMLAGARSAHATVSTPAGSVAGASAKPMLLPGALSLPRDPHAIIDNRYLWDVRGNLLDLYQQGNAAPAIRSEVKDSKGDKNVAGDTHTSYAYDQESRLILASSARHTSRYHYDGNGNRVLEQQGIGNQGDLDTATVKTSFQAGTHRLVGLDPQQKANIAATYDSNGQPNRIGTREYIWDALGRLAEVRDESSTTVRYSYNHRGQRISKASGVAEVGASDGQGQAKGTGAYYLYEDTKLSTELNASGEITRQYFYLGELPLAVIDTPDGATLAVNSTSALGVIVSDLGTIVHLWFSDNEKTSYLHTNHLSAPEAATDAKGALIWQASYVDSGAARVKAQAGFTLNLRLPGQYADVETGLHYNQHRYYDPQRGRYLSPDPLGTPDGPNPYLYVRGNPLKYIDPTGLVLFAFDGTNNTVDTSWLNARNSSLSNVVRFSAAYQDGKVRYITGVGTDHRDKVYEPILAAKFKKGVITDSAGNYSGPARIDRMMLYLQDESNIEPDDKILQIDIVGFSRGASEAREFANRIVGATKHGIYSYKIKGEQRCQKVNFRFMGLWDTVLSTNYSGQGYDLDIPPVFKYVAQAVALNEYRSAPHGVDAGKIDASKDAWFWGNTRAHVTGSGHFGAFPLISIGQLSNAPNRTRIERGFIGAHADIGGGYGANENGLSTVALSWIAAQAQIAGVKIHVQDFKIDNFSNPIMHDQSNALRVGNPLLRPNFQAPKFFGSDTDLYTVEDREVIGAVAGRTQRTQTFGPPEAGGNRSMTNVDTHQFINYTARNTANNTEKTNDIAAVVALRNRTGTVNMVNYMSWLRQHGYGFVNEY